MHRKAADLQYQRPFHLNSSLVPFVVEILIAGYPNTIFIVTVKPGGGLRPY